MIERLTIIPSDRFIGINSYGIYDIQEDLSWIPSNVHAVQWNGDSGFVEYTDGSEDIINFLGIYANAEITYENEVQRRIREEEAEKEEIEANRDYVQELRSKRNYLLSESDWIVVKSYELGEEVPAEWITYRQALRDLPANTEDPKSPVWPIKPV